mmetsp:Transcript_15745/g.36975  ORF Transcript_15745/g.36975 Transcript_15745/m.36975 type:complete len:151 (+) Transcript_15745:1013-1465(+)
MSCCWRLLCQYPCCSCFRHGCQSEELQSCLDPLQGCPRQAPQVLLLQEDWPLGAPSYAHRGHEVCDVRDDEQNASASYHRHPAEIQCSCAETWQCQPTAALRVIANKGWDRMHYHKNHAAGFGPAEVDRGYAPAPSIMESIRRTLLDYLK